jgi:beta-carotene 3-hydroxylase
MLGSMYAVWPVMYIGFGILAYGIAYFLVHEVFIHQRFKWFRNSDNVYFVLSVEHTKCTTNTWEKNKECFGMLIVPWKYLRQELKKANA